MPRLNRVGVVQLADSIGIDLTATGIDSHTDYATLAREKPILITL